MEETNTGFKRLDQTALEYIKEARQHSTDAEIGDYLTKSNYRTPTGKPVGEKEVSAFAILNGMYKTRGERATSQTQNFVKNLDAAALEYIKANQTRGYDKIAKVLASQGYTNKSGRPINSAECSVFACSHGIRRRIFNTERRVTHTVQNQSLGNSDVYQIINSNISADLKLKLIKPLL